jgi:hypothetical protein
MVLTGDLIALDTYQKAWGKDFLEKDDSEGDSEDDGEDNGGDGGENNDKDDGEYNDKDDNSNHEGAAQEGRRASETWRIKTRRIRTRRMKMSNRAS